MNQIFFWQALVCYEKFKYETNPELRMYLEDEKFQQFAKSFEYKVIIVLWGDGGMLRAVDVYQHLGFPFLGINFWNRWFLLHSRETIGNYAFEWVTYPVLRALGTFGQVQKEILAFNEIDIRARDGRILTLKVEGLCFWWGLEFSWDGLIISTPVGSSGYNLSLGGPLLSHGLEMLLITPKAVISPRGLPSYVLPLNTPLRVQNNGRKTGVLVYADSREVYDGESGDFSVQLLPHSSVQILIQKGKHSEWQQKFFSITQW